MSKMVPRSPEFAKAMGGFLDKANEMLVEHYSSKFSSLRPPVLTAEEGMKFIRVVRGEDGGSRSSYCFVDKSNGDVLKCASWKAPAKHARGNIFSEKNGMEGVGPYGAKYL